MIKRTLIVSTLAVGLSLSAGFTWAATSAPAYDKVQGMGRSQEPIYGGQLMTPQEHLAFHASMYAATSAEQWEHILKDHHEQMQARAKERGVTLPDSPQ